MSPQDSLNDGRGGTGAARPSLLVLWPPGCGEPEKAKAFAKTYANVSRQVRNKLQDRKMKKELKTRLSQPCMCGGARSETCTPFTLAELDAQPRYLKCGKAPGPDDICSEQVLHLGPGARTTLLQLLNLSWSTGQVPSSWR